MSVCTVVKEVGTEGSDETSLGLIVTIPAKGDPTEVVKATCDPVKDNKVSATKGVVVDGIAHDVEGVKKSVDSKLCL